MSKYQTSYSRGIFTEYFKNISHEGPNLQNIQIFSLFHLLETLNIMIANLVFSRNIAKTEH